MGSPPFGKHADVRQYRARIVFPIISLISHEVNCFKKPAVNGRFNEISLKSVDRLYILLYNKIRIGVTICRFSGRRKELTELSLNVERKRADNYVSLTWELVKRDLRLKYRRSILGYLWSLLNPLLMMTVMVFVFSYMFRFDIENYALYLICGQTMFNFFNEATNKAMYAIIDNGMLIKKIYVPKYIFPISRVISCFVTTSFSLLAIVIVMLVTRVRIHLSILVFWAPLLYLLVFSCGVGMILSALSVKFRDVTHLYGVLTMAWMYATPIFYPIEAVPESVAAIIRLNPLYVFINLFRDLVLYGNVPALSAWAKGLGMAAAMFAVGAFVFSRLQDDFIYYI